MVLRAHPDFRGGLHDRGDARQRCFRPAVVTRPTLIVCSRARGLQATTSGGWANMTRLASCAGVVGITCLASLFASGADAAEITPDPLVADQLPAQPGVHWVWVNDVVFHHMADGKAFLLDGD